MKLGRIEGEDIGYYHSCGGISSTMFRVYLNSPREFWLRYIVREIGEKRSEAVQFGRVAHGVILEGEEYVVVRSGLDRRTKAGRSEYECFLKENTGRHIIEHGDGVTLDRMVKYGIGQNEAACALLGGCREHEVTYRVCHCGRYLQCRPDGLADKYVVDLKTCRSIGGLVNDFFKRGYHIQAAWYNYVLECSGVEPRDFEFIGVSKEGGYECTVLEYKYEEAARVWKHVCERALDGLLRSLDTGMFANKWGDVINLTTPEKVFHGGR